MKAKVFFRNLHTVAAIVKCLSRCRACTITELSVCANAPYTTTRRIVEALEGLGSLKTSRISRYVMVEPVDPPEKIIDKLVAAVAEAVKDELAHYMKADPRETLS